MIYKKVNHIFKLSLFVGLIFFSSFAFALLKKEGKSQICFFELDNTVTSRNFKNQKPSHVEIHIFSIKENEKAKQAFERMIRESLEKGKKCDSLVISGHHTGDWFGKKGTLWLKDMEDLSCKKKYQNWFQNIKALWLDGCNTVTDDFIKKSLKPTPDSESVRVISQEIQADQINQYDIRDYQQSYSGSLDEYSPLSSRYLRMFPNTQIYGFNGAAPTGVQLGKRSFVFNHLTHLGKALKAEKHVGEQYSDFQRGLKALSDDFCNEETLSAWEELNNETQSIENQDYQRARKLGCDLILAKQVLENPNSESTQKALAEKILKDSKYKNTVVFQMANDILKNPKSEKAIRLAKRFIIKTLKEIEEEDRGLEEKKLKYSRLLFNNLYDTWNLAKKQKNQDEVFFKEVRSQFQTKSFSQFIEEKIQSPITASLKKGDYLKFYTDIHDLNLKREGRKEFFVKEHVRKLLDRVDQVFYGLTSPREKKLSLSTRRVLAVSVADQLLQYNLLNKKQLEELIKNKSLFSKKIDNPFIQDTWMKLKFTKKPETVFHVVKTARSSSEMRFRALRIGTQVYLKFINKNLDLVKKNLARLSNEAENIQDIEAFLGGVDNCMKGRSDKEKAELLLKLSSQTEENMERFIITYANQVLLKKDIRKSFCIQIKEELKRGHRSGMDLTDCSDLL